METEVRRVAMVSMHTSPAALAGSADAGGMNVAILSLARELAAYGVEVDLLTLADGEQAVTAMGHGVTLHELAVAGAGALSKDALSSVSDGFGEAVAVLAGRNGRKYDVVHAHYWLSGIATLPVAIELGIPFVQSFHTLGEMKQRSMPHGAPSESERRVRSETYLALQADAVIASSTAEVASLIEEVGAPVERVWIIPPGVDTDLFTPDPDAAESVRSALGIAHGRPIVAVVGRVQPIKGQRLAVQVLAALSEPRPVLVIAGDATPGEEAYLAELIELAAVLGVGGDVLFVGALAREAVAELLAAAAVTLVPSRSETFGLVALESAASGTPVVAQRVAGLTESVAEGESGILIDSRDPTEWARAVRSVLDDEELRMRLELGAREHAEAFSWATSAAVLLDVYRGLLETD